MSRRILRSLIGSLIASELISCPYNHFGTLALLFRLEADIDTAFAVAILPILRQRRALDRSVESLGSLVRLRSCSRKASWMIPATQAVSSQPDDDPTR